MRGCFRVAVCAGAAFVTAGLSSYPARAQSAGAIFGGIAGGVIGGVIAGSIAANARPRPVVVYAPQRTVRVVREVRPARRKVARAQARPMQPAAGPQGAQVVDASADPFASPQGSATTAVKQTR